MDIFVVVLSFAVCGTAVFSVGAWSRRFCVKKLREARAFSPETAVTREEAKMESDGWAITTLKILVKTGKVKMTEASRFYLDENNKSNLKKTILAELWPY